MIEEEKDTMIASKRFFCLVNTISSGISQNCGGRFAALKTWLPQKSE